VAVCGAPASGKTTLTQEVGRRLNDDQHIPTIVVPMDGYHFYKHELDAMPDPEAMHARRGAPWTYNVRVFLARIYYVVSSRVGRNALIYDSDSSRGNKAIACSIFCAA